MSKTLLLYGLKRFYEIMIKQPCTLYSDHNVTVGVFSTRQKPVYVQIQAVHEDVNIGKLKTKTCTMSIKKWKHKVFFSKWGFVFGGSCLFKNFYFESIKLVL